MLQHTTRVCLDNDHIEGEPSRIEIFDAGSEPALLFSVVVGDDEKRLIELDLSITDARNLAATLIARADIAEHNDPTT